jgi:ligand-binding SRPBCC domain-containing protein
MVSIVERTSIHAPIERCFYLSLNIDLHQESTARTQERAVAGVTTGFIGPGERVTWRGRHSGIMLRHTSEITAYEAPTFFEDVMVSGVFRSFRHRHSFYAEANGTVMEDRVGFAAPVPLLGRMIEVLVLKRYLGSFLRERNAFIKQIAESEEWRKYLAR